MIGFYIWIAAIGLLVITLLRKSLDIQDCEIHNKEIE